MSTLHAEYQQAIFCIAFAVHCVPAGRQLQGLLSAVCQQPMLLNSVSSPYVAICQQARCFSELTDRVFPRVRLACVCLCQQPMYSICYYWQSMYILVSVRTLHICWWVPEVLLGSVFSISSVSAGLVSPVHVLISVCSPCTYLLLPTVQCIGKFPQNCFD
jgi:hypothetical protein